MLALALIASQVLGQAAVEGRITVSADGRPADCSKVAVYLEPVSRRRAALPPKTAEIEQRTSPSGKVEFSPALVVIPRGGKVCFPNRQNNKHNVFSVSDVTPFDIDDIRKGDAPCQQFRVAGDEHIQCNIHHWMHAWIKVVDTPYYAQPADCRFHIEAPPGEYRLVAWHAYGDQASEKVALDHGVVTHDFALKELDPPANTNKYGGTENLYR